VVGVIEKTLVGELLVGYYTVCYNKLLVGKSMFKNIKIALLVSFTLLASGCATQSFMVKANGNAQPTTDQMKTFFINGLGQQQITNANTICGGSGHVYKVETQQTFVDGLLGMITFGIYTPRTARVYCTH